MGTKYIVELEDGEHLYKTTINALGNPVLRAAEKIPYTEPDLEQVRKEGYEQGYKDMRNEINKEVRKSAQEIHTEITADAYKRGYNAGLADAWEAARKICCSVTDGGLNLSTLNAIFGSQYSMGIMHRFTASEAIERLKPYEQEQEELGIQKYFKNGEEVIDADSTKAVILRVSEDNYCQVYTEKGCIENWHIHTYKFHKTGRYFPEITTVLEKMGRVAPKEA